MEQIECIATAPPAAKHKTKKCHRKKLAAIQDKTAAVGFHGSAAQPVLVGDSGLVTQRSCCREQCYVVQDFSNNSSKIPSIATELKHVGGIAVAETASGKPSRDSIKQKIFQLLCVRTEEMGSTHTKQSTNRSNAAQSPAFPALHVSSLHHHNSKTQTSSNHGSGHATSSSRRSLHCSRKERLPQNLEGLVSILRLSATIDEKPTTVDERSSAVLKYRTPHFRASATVQIPAIPDKETWQIGWIQACTDMVFLNTYGAYGVSSWEFPELKTGGYSMISDSDGRNYPWYGSRTEVVTITGPTKSDQTVQVSMNDNFYPHITWSVPLRNHRDPALTHVRRTQGFYTWLVAKNVDADKIYILKTVRWSMHLEIAVDPTKPLGHRAHLIGSGIQQQPTLLSYNVEIPRCALEPPNANSAQTLIWYPTVGTPQVIVPPKWSPDNMDSHEE